MCKSEVGREASRRWREKNKEKNRAYCRKWQIDHPDAKRMHDKRYRDSHPEKHKEHRHTRRARERSASGRFTTAEWIALKEAFHNQCAFCGSGSPLTIDHIVPLARGGTNFIANIQPLCGPCNQTKGTK